MSAPDAPRWTGRRVLIALLLFFGLVAAVNAAMIWIALESWPGRSVRGAAGDSGVPVVAVAVAGVSGEGGGIWTG